MLIKKAHTRVATYNEVNHRLNKANSITLGKS